MSDHRYFMEKGKTIGEKKHHPNIPKDIKKKVAFIQKKINDLSQQRKFAYKNSVKVKRVIHNQVNQIVKCLRARERSLWSDVDEAYLSQDAVITDELSKLQSLYAHCQTLFNHIEDCNLKPDILSAICSDVSVSNVGENADLKPLEFISDFEGMKTRAESYGYLETDFSKKDDFVLVAEGKNSNQSDINCKKYCRKEETSDPTFTVVNTCAGSDKIYLEKCVTSEADCEDFQIVDLMHNMEFHDTDDYEDFIMADDVTCTFENEISSSENDSAVLIKIHNNSNHSCKTQGSNEDFNPEKEWHEIKEMNRKLASFDELASKLSEKRHTSHKSKKALDVKILNMLDKKYQKSMLTDTNCWLQDLSAKNCSPKIDTTSEKVNIEINYTSPTDLIKNAFKPYFIKDDIQNWLLSK